MHATCTHCAEPDFCRATGGCTLATPAPAAPAAVLARREAPLTLPPLNLLIERHLGPTRALRSQIAQALRRDDVRAALWRCLWRSLPALVREPKRAFHLLLDLVAAYVDPEAPDPRP